MFSFANGKQEIALYICGHMSYLFSLFLPRSFFTNDLFFQGCLPDDERVQGFLDSDGLPPIGAKLETGDPYYW